MAASVRCFVTGDHYRGEESCSEESVSQEGYCEEGDEEGHPEGPRNSWRFSEYELSTNDPAFAEPLPTYVVGRVFALRDKLLARSFSDFYRHTLSADQLLQLASTAAEIIGRGVTYECVAASLMELLGQELTPALAATAAWRLAGNVASLQAGNVVTAWTTQARPEWIPVELQSAYRDKTQTSFGISATFVVLAGTPSGMMFRQFLSDKLCRVAALRVGFTRRHGKYPYHGSIELVGLRMFVQAMPSQQANKLVFSGIRGSSGLLAYNRQNVLAYRIRAKPCPREYKHPCRNCVIGRDQCPGAVFSQTLQARLCPVCKEQGFFYPAETESCVECQQRARLAAR